MNEYAPISAFPMLQALDAGEIFSVLQRDGFYCAKGVTVAEIPLLQETVLGLVEARRSQNLFGRFTIDRPGDTLTQFSGWVNSPNVISLLRDVACRALDNAQVRGDRLRDVLRVIIGQKAPKRHVFLCHYDRTLVTALVPIFIPDGTPEEVGDFICIPNRRQVRKSVLVDMAEKILAQGVFGRWHFGQRVRRGDKGMRTIRLEPGNMYFFLGYRTLHANFGCVGDRLRATLLFHFGDPYPPRALRGMLRKIRQRGIVRATRKRDAR